MQGRTPHYVVCPWLVEHVLRRTAPQKRYSDMSIAATRNRRSPPMIPKSVYQLLFRLCGEFGEPLIQEDAEVAANPTTMRWVAMLARELKVFEGATEQFSLTPPTGLNCWHDNVLAFAPDGPLFVVLNRGEDMEMQNADLGDRKFTARFRVNVRSIKSSRQFLRKCWE